LQNEQFHIARCAQKPKVFQLDAKLGTLGEEQTFQVLDKEIDRRAEIKSKIKDIGFDKTKKLWKLLDQFLDVFTWHKGGIGCCKIG
jgi:hypothetical protein